jgi:hypothetical protein
MRRAVNFPPSSTLFLGEATSSRVRARVIAGSPRLRGGSLVTGKLSVTPAHAESHSSDQKRSNPEAHRRDCDLQPTRTREDPTGRGVLNPASMSAEVWAIQMVRHCALILEETARAPDLPHRVSLTAQHGFCQKEIVSGGTEGK